MTQPLKPLGRCYACPLPAVLRVTNGGIGKCRGCADLDGASPWGSVSRVESDASSIVPIQRTR